MRPIRPLLQIQPSLTVSIFLDYPVKCKRFFYPSKVVIDHFVPCFDLKRLLQCSLKITTWISCCSKQFQKSYGSKGSEDECTFILLTHGFSKEFIVIWTSLANHYRSRKITSPENVAVTVSNKKTHLADFERVVFLPYISGTTWATKNLFISFSEELSAGRRFFEFGPKISWYLQKRV